VGPWAGLDRICSPDRPARNELQYRLLVEYEAGRSFRRRKEPLDLK